MSKVVLSMGFMMVLVFVMTVYSGYTALSDAARTLTAAVEHAIAGTVMKPANLATGGGYINEGVGGTHLQLSLTSLTTGVDTALPRVWAGSQVREIANGALQWTLPSASAAGFHVSGPITIAPLSESATDPPTLSTTVVIPVAVPTLTGTWTGRIHRAIVLPLAGQTQPETFVLYH